MVGHLNIVWSVISCYLCHIGESHYFSLFKTLGLRVKDMVFAGKLATCAVILHNLAVRHGDFGDAFENEARIPSRREPTVPEGHNQVGQARERRRNEIVNYFNR